MRMRMQAKLGAPFPAFRPRDTRVLNNLAPPSDSHTQPQQGTQ